MNEHDSLLDAREQRQDNDSAERACDRLPPEGTDCGTAEQQPVTEVQAVVECGEVARARGGADVASHDDVSPNHEGVAEPSDVATAARTSEGDVDDAGTYPSGEHGDGTASAEGTESQQRHVTLQAGTDEESLRALALCREKVVQMHLRMHPLAARWEGERHVIIFFRAEEKVDFRKLVRELSRLLHARIELRQVGPREQGKLCGLVGKCGYPLCCQTFLSQFAQSTIKMAKTQELALNPMKISGVCGRLLCCLNYEQQMYLDAKANMPRTNKIVDTESGPGKVVAVNVLKQTVTVQLETMTRELRLDQLRPPDSQG